MVTPLIKAARESDRKQASRIRAVRPSRALEAQYRSDLTSMASAFRKATEAKILPLAEKVLSGDALVPKVTKALDDLDEAFARATKARASKIASRLVSRADTQVKERLSGMMGSAFGVDLAGFLSRSPKLKAVIDAATAENIGLIKSIPEKYLGRVRSSVMSAVTGGLRFETLREGIMEDGGITERQARMIARDQVSKLNSSINRVRQQDLGITQYKWSTSGDERVRQTHRDNDGKIFDWSEPPAETGHPGDDYQCRCVAIPIINLEEDDGN